MPLTTTAATSITNYLLRATAITGFTPGTYYLALLTADPGTGGTITSEVPASSGYARQAVTWGAATGGTASTTTVLTFGPATASWGTIAYVALCAAAVEAVADVVTSAPLDVAVAVGINQSLQVNAGDLTWVLS